MFLAALAGGGAGILAGLFGIGGGVIIVPALFQLYQAVGCSPATAIGMAIATSLACILPTSLSSLRAHHRLQNLDVTRLKRSLMPLTLGALTGSVAVAYYSGLWLNLVFGALLLLVSLVTAYRLSTVGIDKTRDTSHDSAVLRAITSSAIYLLALLSSLAGVGGGALGAPLLMALGYSTHRAIGTAAGFGFAIALPAVLCILLLADTPADAPWGSVALINLPTFVLLALCASIAAPLGAKLGKLLPAKVLAYSLVCLLLVLSLRMISAAL